VTTAVAALPAVADLILIRMALPSSTPKRVREDVGKLLGTDLSADDFAAARAELAATGCLTRRQRNAFVITNAGRERAFHFLGLSEFPPRASWGTVIAKYLFPKATGLPPETAVKLDDGDKLAAMVLKRKHGLSGGSTVRQVLEGIVCKELGYPAETTLAGLGRAVLSKLIGSDERLTMEQLAVQVPRIETGLTDVRADTVRRKLVRDWLAGGTAAPRPPVPLLSEPFDLSAFAATVRKLAATSPPQDRFHDNKVFIAPLWRASQLEPGFPHLHLSEFKRRLVEANARHLLHLSRADLVSAMDPQLVAESEATYLNATFHFVLLEGDRP
jgi:hypothetical protein